MSDEVVRGEAGTVPDGPEYDIDFREHPDRYRHTPDERGVFKIEPYKSELLPAWTIADLEGAREAAATIHDRFGEYRDNEEFVGMDMARKYLQMGWTRALRYAKYPGGRKRDGDGTERDPRRWYDEEKREVSLVYKEYLDRVREDDRYQQLKERHRERHG